MKISIGILAWNEAKTIGKTICSLFQQTLISPQTAFESSLEIICIPNGCTDDTAQVAHKFFDSCLAERPVSSPPITCRVVEIPEAGKSNAWNQYVHEASSDDADYLFLMDADIWFNNKNTLLRMLEALQTHPHARVAVDIPVKDIEHKKSKTSLDKLSLSLSTSLQNEFPTICGQLYCGKASCLRSIWLPRGITIEDGFLTKMIWTDELQIPNDYERIIRAAGACHLFEAYTTLRDILLHQRSIALGSAVNTVAYEYLKKQRGTGGAGPLIQKLNTADPAWLEKITARYLADRQDLFRMRFLSSPRFQRYAKKRGLNRIKNLPVLLTGVFMDNLVNLTARHFVRKKNDLHTWKRTHERQP